MLNPQHLKELQASGIDPALAELNFESLQGNQIYDRLCYSEKIDRVNTGRLSLLWLNRYRQASQGGWWVSGLDPLDNWSPMEWGAFKPDQPRETTQDGKNKLVKYEHPAKVESRAFFLRVTVEIWEKVATRNKVEMPQDIVISQDGEALGFWRWVIDNPKVSITICEGAKKSAALLSIGVCAVSLPGIFNGYRQPKDGLGNKIGLPFLTPDLEVIAQKDRVINFCFDQDEKLSTRKNVNTAVTKTGKLFTRKGCSILVIEWEPKHGKGIDDVLQNQGEDFVNQIFKNALDLQIWQTILQSRLSYKADLVINREFLTDRFICEKSGAEKFIIPKELLAPIGTQLLLLKSYKGSGKTEYLACLVEPFLREGRKVLLLTHRVQLGKALCTRLGIPYVEELRESETGRLLGYGLCHHSMHAKSAARFDPQEWEGAVIIIDELVQVLWDVLSSPLIESHQVKILQNLKESLRIALSTGGMLIGCDADLNDWAIDYINQLIGFKIKQHLVVNEWRIDSNGKHWNVFNYQTKTPIKLVWKLIKHIRNGGNPFILCSSQQENSKWSTQNLEGFLRSLFPDKRVLRIDSETIADPTHPAFGCTSKLDLVLAGYDIVLASPTLETGVDIRRITHFDSVWGIFWGVQTCDGVSQFLGRYRKPADRHIWVNKVGLSRIGNGEKSAKHLWRSTDKSTKDLILRLQNGGFDDLIEDDFQNESINAWASRGALINLESKQYCQTILKKIQDEGHILIDADEDFDVNSEDLDDLKDELTDFRNDLYKAHREAVEVSGNPTDDEYQELKKRRVRTKDELRKLEHGRLARRYQVPVDADLVEKDDDGWHPKIKLHYHLTVGRKFVDFKDKNAASNHLNNSDSKVWRPTFTKRLMASKVAAIEVLGLPKLFGLSQITLEDVLPIVEAGKKYENDLKILGISANWDDKPIAVVKLLVNHLFNLTMIRLKRVGGKGNQQWLYSGLAPAFVLDEKKKPVLDASGKPQPIWDDRQDIFTQWFISDTEAMEPEASQPIDGDGSQIGFGMVVHPSVVHPTINNIDRGVYYRGGCATDESGSSTSTSTVSGDRLPALAPAPEPEPEIYRSATGEDVVILSLFTKPGLKDEDIPMAKIKYLSDGLVGESRVDFLKLVS